MVTVTVCTDHFATLAQGVMRGAHMPDLIEHGLALVPHPLAELAPDAVRARALTVLPEIERRLGLAP